MRGFMLSIVLVIVLGVTACSSLPIRNEGNAEAKLATHSVGLTAQKLEVGECGLFFWSLSTPAIFTFFHKESDPQARFFQNATEFILTANVNTPAFNDGSELSLTYSFPTGEAVHLKGRFADMLEGGQRITNASIQTATREGWQEITPVSGVYVCR